jgi:serine/threonine protein kinase
VLLFDMLQGEIPFKNSDRIIENRPLFKEPISNNARDLVRWMLSNDCRKRPSLQQILEHAWMKEYVHSNSLSAITGF